MKKNVLKITAILGLTSVLLNSCGPKENAPLVYFPDMYFPVAYDPLMKAEIAYSDHENEIPALLEIMALQVCSVEGSVAQIKTVFLKKVNFQKTQMSITQVMMLQNH